MSKSQSRQRPHVAAVRLSDAERATLDARAAAAGLTVSDFLRSAALEKEPLAASTERQELSAALVRLDAHLGALGRIGNNANQIAKLSNESGEATWRRGEVKALADELARHRAELIEIRAAVLAALGLRSLP